MAKEKKYRYVSNGGLAFDEERALKKLSKLSKQGWFLDKLTLFRGYRLVKGQPRELQYSMDYRKLEIGNQDDYFEMFQDAGWEHRCSYEDLHFFSADFRTAPIYTDKESHLYKYKNQRNLCIKGFLFSIIVSVIMYVITKWVITAVAFEPIKLIVYMIFGVTVGITLCFAMMSIAYVYRERKIIKIHNDRNI